jgi:hypothetical protein
VLLTLLVAVALSGCQTTAGGSSPALQTFDAVYAGAVQAETLIIQETSMALAGRVISPAQASNVLAVTDSVKAVLDAAKAAAMAGNSGLATANVASATAAIAALSICLTAKPLTVVSFAGCTAKLTPVAVQS